MKVVRIDRKPITTERVHSKRFIAAHSVQLIDAVKDRIRRDWRRGISIAYLAKDFQLTTRQAAAVVWEGRPLDGPSAREVITQMRRAA